MALCPASWRAAADFCQTLDDTTLAFADYRGNRQYISVGNLAVNDRAALILMDYPGRRRLKMYVHVEARSLVGHADLRNASPCPATRRKPNAPCFSSFEAFDWNCPQHIDATLQRAPSLHTVSAPIRERY